jgi:hypothetical protein
MGVCFFSALLLAFVRGALGIPAEPVGPTDFFALYCPLIGS